VKRVSAGKDLGPLRAAKRRVIHARDAERRLVGVRSSRGKEQMVERAILWQQPDDTLGEADR